MPRPKSDVQSVLSDLASRIEGLLDAARREGREQALAEVRSLVGGAVAVRRGPGRPPKSASAPAAAPAAKPARAKKARKSSWEGLTDEQRLARVNAIRKGRGLPVKSSL